MTKSSGGLGAENVDVEQAMAVIEKGQQLAGHFPSAGALDSARRILTGELSVEDAELELIAALASIVAQANPACRACGTWTCDDCAVRRPCASRFASIPQRCATCSSTNGHMAPVIHRESRADDHDASYRRSLADEVPLRYPLS